MISIGSWRKHTNTGTRTCSLRPQPSVTAQFRADSQMKGKPKIETKKLRIRKNRFASLVYMIWFARYLVISLVLGTIFSIKHQLTDHSSEPKTHNRQYLTLYPSMHLKMVGNIGLCVSRDSPAYHHAIPWWMLLHASCRRLSHLYGFWSSDSLL